MSSAGLFVVVSKFEGQRSWFRRIIRFLNSEWICMSTECTDALAVFRSVALLETKVGYVWFHSLTDDTAANLAVVTGRCECSRTWLVERSATRRRYDGWPAITKVLLSLFIADDVILSSLSASSSSRLFAQVKHTV